jgi:hypothetical protein
MAVRFCFLKFWILIEIRRELALTSRLLFLRFLDSHHGAELAVRAFNIFLVKSVTDISPERVIDLNKAVPRASAMSIVTSPVLMLQNLSIDTRRLYSGIAQLLTRVGHAKVFLKEDLPERWHLKNSELVSPVVAVADLGWTMKLKTVKSRELSSVHVPLVSGIGGSVEPALDSGRYRGRIRNLPPNHPRKGDHGFDNVEPDMQALFVATGPAFRKARRLGSMRAVDLYPLLCHIFGADPAPNNGSVHVTEAAMTPIVLH